MKRRAVGEMLEKARTDAFTDGVFAIAITLLVLEIHVPDLHQGTDTEMSAFIARLGGPLLTYALSFATVGIIWVNHHATYRMMPYTNRTANGLNLLLLGIVCFIPFPTALLSRYGPLPSAVAFYGATFTAMSIAYGLNWQYSAALQHRIDPKIPKPTLAQALPGLIGTAIYLAGTLLAFVAPRISVWIYVIVAIYYALPGLFTRHHRDDGPETFAGV